MEIVPPFAPGIVILSAVWAVSLDVLLAQVAQALAKKVVPECVIGLVPVALAVETDVPEDVRDAMVVQAAVLEGAVLLAPDVPIIALRLATIHATLCARIIAVEFAVRLAPEPVMEHVKQLAMDKQAL